MHFFSLFSQRFKQPVGYRLHLAIASNIYSASVVWQGPQVSSVALASPADPSTVLLSLQPGSTASKLHFAGTTNCGVNTTEPACCTLFPFAANTQLGHALRASKVVLSENAVSVGFGPLAPNDRIVQFSYAYDATAFPQCALYNQFKLPMTLFNVTLPTEGEQQQQQKQKLKLKLPLHPRTRRPTRILGEA